ncbi:MAG: IS66 family transposase [Acidobacteriota bacterium]|nr:IS66 family transposase [Acidobacteriota bacterium]
MAHFVEQLLSHLAEVERHVGHRQQYTIDRLLKDWGRLTKRVERLKAQVLKQEMLNAQLTRRLQELQTELARQAAQGSEVAPAAVRRDSHNSGLPPSLDLPCAKAVNAIRRTRSLRRKSGKRVGGQAGHQGATLQQVETPDRLRVHTPRVCRRCRASLAECAVVGRQGRQVFELPPVVLEVTEHWAQTKRCDQCGERTKARFPSDVKAPVQYGQRVRAVATYLHQYQLLPFARTSEAMRDLFASSISPGTIHTTRHRAAAKLVGVEEQIKHAIKHAAVIGADETGLRVAGKSAWIHVARTDGLTHYGYDARRSKAAVDAIGILPTFTGTCVRDGWFIYDEYAAAKHALCNVHLLRELVYVEEVCAEQQQWTQPLTKLLLDIKAEVERAKAQGATKLSDEQLTTYRARYDRLVKRAARLNPPPKKEKPDALAKRFKVVKVKRRDPAAPLIRRLQTKRDQILRFMTDFQVPFDNNGSERDIRMVKLYQKISGCFRTPEGARAFCRIRSYLSTARKQGHSPLVALERTFAGQPLALDTS